ncbi:MAG: hydrogenase nickel incorporation protein HypB [Firmicutes bacterium]|nr:hydrogenase nickel incorporation protein HypB [Bacillota bacterium]
MRLIKLEESITESNDRDADALRQEMKEKGTLMINLMSAAGSGKTTLLSRIIKDMTDTKIGVVEADIDSTVDAETIEALGAVAIQAHTNGMCHMDAGMTANALHAMGYDGLDLVFLENVGNLICPAEYDTGSGRKLMITSVQEGDDKPLKYPLMFIESDALVIAKIDAISYFSFDIEKFKERVYNINPRIKIFPVSAKTGEGMSELEEWLRQQVREWRN